eukprot:TRINITY_DN2051_c0_g1_i2.p1 TRINITY_DN2051_c0_g1~~TRINITY_DN2051_c0_g1_i2.p1  ORF type:complete len:293 (+),score=26.62 TRINITY_DN2051_c0_g1_i2:104-982(+)
MDVSHILAPLVNTPYSVGWDAWVAISSAFVFSQITYVITHWYCSKNSSSYRKLPLIEQKEWQSRIVSTIHAVVVFPIVLWVCLTDYDYHADPVNGRSEWSDFAMCLGVGYFLSDFILIMIYNIPPLWPIVCHHVFAGWGFLLAVSSVGASRWFGCYMLLTEATTPFNNTHWALVKSGMKDSKITKWIGYIWTINWILFRLAINPFLVYRVWYFWNEIASGGIYTTAVLMTNLVFLVLLNSVYFVTGPFRDLWYGERPEVSPKVAESRKKGFQNEDEVRQPLSERTERRRRGG